MQNDPSTVFFHTSQVNSALLIYCFTLGGLAVAVVMDLDRFV